MSCQTPLYASDCNDVKKKFAMGYKEGELLLCSAASMMSAMDTETIDPFEGLGKALARLRVRAGYATQTQASDVLKIDKGQISRWENEIPRPTLENLGRVLAGYGATLADLAGALSGEDAKPVQLGPSDEELLRSLAEAIRRVEGRQTETEGRVERLEQDLTRTTG
jgi:transcriptional regulator with XRE-family HTH domain